MQKPSEWDNTEAFTGESRALPAGGYICKILGAKEELSRAQKPQLVIMFDIAEGEHKEYFLQLYDRKRKDNADAKWQGIYRQQTEGKSLPFFKGMITAIENSNTGYTWNFDEATLKGKWFGGVFGQEEYEGQQDGKIRLSTKCQQIRTIDTIREGKFEIPQIKRLKQTDNPFGGQVIDDSDIPF